RKCGWSLSIEEGRLVFTIGDGSGATSRAVSDRALFEGVWYSVIAVFDPAEKAIRLHQTSVVNRTNSRFGLVVPLDSDTVVSAAADVSPADSGTALLIAGVGEAAAENGRTWCIANYNGKIDAPKMYRRALRDEDARRLSEGIVVEPMSRLAHWDFAAGIGPNGIPTDHVVEVSGNGHHGRCVNQPDRGSTGWNWDGHEENFKHCPEQYGALWFHEDCLDDCRWEKDFELVIPEGLKSDFYAVRIRFGDTEDYIPFFVLPPRGTATAKVLVLASTLSYLAYANEQIMHKADIGQAVAGHTPVLNENDIELHRNLEYYGLSTYDGHIDGRGVQYTSWRRPILNIRPKHRQGFGSIWELPADLHLIDWLNHNGFEYDVATEHDLHEQGVDLLRRYKVVLTGSHPEYQTWANADAWEDYLADGGRGMYLAANGMYWIVSIHPEKPWVMEVRKELGVTAWEAPPGEHHYSTNGRRGGRFRGRARATQKIWGTGMSSFGFDHSGYFVQMPDSQDERAAWITAGIAPDERIGDGGLVGGGAGGYELDRYDLSLGTPPNTLLLASSVEHSVVYTVIPDDKSFPHPGMNGGEHPFVRADITYFSTANGGGMFSTSSISWLGSLSWNSYDNNVSKMTKNVLEQFMKDEPAPLV
ncbi:MAG TPA: N,N-dimethylformamidase beta subunit family domain-containing protein, partial [Nitrospira sp.]|nr:N,N-dimethylformamidase beta subunit family domain-containing protein [Nitrospira sp.]